MNLSVLSGHFRRMGAAYIVLLIALIPTVFAYLRASRLAEDRDRDQFDETVRDKVAAIENRMNTYEDALRGIRGLLVATPAISPEQWRRYLLTIGLKTAYPGITHVGYAPRIERVDIQAHEAYVRGLGFPGYSVSPANSKTSLPIMFLDSLDGATTRLLGLDIAQQPGHALATEEASRTGESVATGRVALFSRPGSNPTEGVVIYVPVYTAGAPRSTPAQRVAGLQGFVFGVFQMSELMDGIFGNQPDPEVDFELFDDTRLTAAHLLYDQDRVFRAGDPGQHPRFSSLITEPALSRVWGLYFCAKPGSALATRSSFPLVVLAGGVVLALALFGIAWVQVSARTSSERLTAELRDSESALRTANQRLEVNVRESLRAEEKLRHSETLYSSLVESLPQCIFRKDLEGCFTFCNQRMSGLLNTPLSQIIGKRDVDLYPADLAAKYEHDDRRVLESGGLMEADEEHRLPDGTKIFVHIVKIPLYDAQGKATGIQGMYWDVTGQKQAEEALAAEKERLAVTLRCIGDGVITTDTEGRVVLSNMVAERMTGWAQAEACGQPLVDVLHFIQEDDRKRLHDAVERIVKQADVVELGQLTILVGQDGAERAIAPSAAPIRDRAGKIVGVVLVFRDITDQQRLQAEWLKASKLESIGILAGGLAHDFNNILMIIIGNLSIVKLDLDPASDIYASLNQVEKAALRAKDLTRQLLTFARGGAPRTKPAYLADLLKDSIVLSVRGSNAHCTVALDADLWPVEVDEGQFNQVISNLLINARQAMPRGGVIRIQGRNIAPGAHPGLLVENREYVQLSIADKGTGIAPEHLSKIFDPYFTTKRSGHGLGLATAYSIINRHQGFIQVHSKPGEGATFHIFLPRSSRPPNTRTEAGSMATPGQGRILVMDDEPMICTLARSFLQRLGYQVEVARDGREALGLYGQASSQGQPFDLVIMDLTVPGGMGGLEAIKLLLELDPQAKVLVSSGYSNDPVMADFKASGFCGVVAKPYKMEDLSRVLQELMRTRTS